MRKSVLDVLERIKCVEVLVVDGKISCRKVSFLKSQSFNSEIRYKYLHRGYQTFRLTCTNRYAGTMLSAMTNGC